MTNEALLAELKDRLTRTQPDWVDDYRSGEVLKTDEAAIIAACSSETIRRRAAEAAERGRPIGVLIAKAVWFISLKRLLEDIELRDGITNAWLPKAVPRNCSKRGRHHNFRCDLWRQPQPRAAGRV